MGSGTTLHGLAAFADFRLWFVFPSLSFVLSLYDSCLRYALEEAMSLEKMVQRWDLLGIHCGSPFSSPPYSRYRLGSYEIW
jgi:hypothetical protein